MGEVKEVQGQMKTDMEAMMSMKKIMEANAVAITATSTVAKGGPLGTSTLTFKGLHILAFRGLHALTFRGLHVLTFGGLHVLTFRGLHVLTFRGLHALAFRGLRVLAFRGLHVLTLGTRTLTFRGLHVLTIRGLHVLTFRGLHVLTLRGLHALAFRGLHVLPFRGLHVLTFRGLHILTFRGLHVLTFRGLHALAFRGLRVLAFRGLHILTLGTRTLTFRGLHVLAVRGLHVLTFRGPHVHTFRGLHVLAAKGLHVLTFGGLHVLTFRGLHVLTFRGLHVLAFKGLHALTLRGLHVLAFRGLHALTFRGLRILTFRGLHICVLREFKFLGHPQILEGDQLCEHNQRGRLSRSYYAYRGKISRRRVRVMRTNMTTLTQIWMTLLLSNIPPDDHNADLPPTEVSVGLCHRDIGEDHAHETPSGPGEVQQGPGVSSSGYGPLSVLQGARPPQQGHAIVTQLRVAPTRHPVDLEEPNRSLGFPALVTGLCRSYRAPVPPASSCHRDIGITPARHSVDLEKSNRVLGFPALIMGLYQFYGVPVTPYKVIKPPTNRAFIKKYCAPRQALGETPQQPGDSRRTAATSKAPQLIYKSWSIAYDLWLTSRRPSPKPKISKSTRSVTDKSSRVQLKTQTKVDVPSTYTTKDVPSNVLRQRSQAVKPLMLCEWGYKRILRRFPTSRVQSFWMTGPLDESISCFLIKVLVPITFRGLYVLAIRGLHILACRGLHTLAFRGLCVLIFSVLHIHTLREYKMLNRDLRSRFLLLVPGPPPDIGRRPTVRAHPEREAITHLVCIPGQFHPCRCKKMSADHAHQHDHSYIDMDDQHSALRPQCQSPPADVSVGLCRHDIGKDRAHKTPSGPEEVQQGPGVSSSGIAPTRCPVDPKKSNRALGFPALVTGLCQSYRVPVAPSKVISPLPIELSSRSTAAPDRRRAKHHSSLGMAGSRQQARRHHL
ncbi:Dynein heavy chain [Glycine soja]